MLLQLGVTTTSRKTSEHTILGPVQEKKKKKKRISISKLK